MAEYSAQQKKYIDSVEGKAHASAVLIIGVLEAEKKELLEALKALLKEAVILSEEYLQAFRDLPDSATIQGWDKARWQRALIASKTAKAAIAKAGE